MDHPHLSLCLPRYTDRAEGIHKADLQCGSQAQFSVDSSAKGEMKRGLRKSRGTLDKGRKKLELTHHTSCFSSYLRLISFTDKFLLRGSLSCSLAICSKCLNTWNRGREELGKGIYIY